MNPLEEAVYNSWLEVSKDIDRRKAAKEVAETIEDFSFDEKEESINKIDAKNQKFYAVRSENFSVEKFQKTEGGYIVKDIVLLEDGYIPGRILFQKGAMKKGYDNWKKDKNPLLVNNSHIPIQWDLMNGGLGAITDIRIEKFGDNNDRTRAIVDIFLDDTNPVVQWIYSFGNRMNAILKKNGQEGNVWSVSAEVLLDDPDLIDFAGSFVWATEGVEFTGMGIVFNPANLSSFGTVNSFKNNQFSFKNQIKKSPTLFNLLSNSEMTEEQKKRLAELMSKASLSEDEEKELQDLETSKEGSDDSAKDEEEKTDPVEEKIDSEEEVEEEKKEEEKEEEPKEEAEEEETEEKSEDEEEEKEPVKSENSATGDKVGEKLSTLETALAKLTGEIEQLKFKVNAYEKALKDADGSILSRELSGGQSGEQLSKAQRVSRDGKLK